MSECRVCRSADIRAELALGAHPVSSHLSLAADCAEAVYDIGLGTCAGCGVVQLLQPLPFEALVPPFDWFTYREPEEHLDNLVEHIQALPGIHASSRIIGVSVKDTSTLERLSRLGFQNTHVISPHTDLGITEINAGVESVQHYLCARGGDAWVGGQVSGELVIGRHIVEHAEDVRRFMAALNAVLVPGGYVVLEVPDCLANMQREDITMVWEEHTTYFTPDTFRDLLPGAGFENVMSFQYPSAFEDCLVVIGRKSATTSGQMDDRPQNSDRRSPSILFDYAQAFSRWRHLYRRYFEERIKQGQRIALYGAGHLGCAFVNYYGLADLFHFVIDDTTEKQGLFLSGSKLPVVPASYLVSENIDLCLLCLSPDSEDKVIMNNTAFTENGGQFFSIFAASQRSVRTVI